MNAIGRGRGEAWGSGWISGVLAVTCGALGLGGVLCLLFPDWLTTPDARARYPMGLIRLLVHAMLVTGFGMGALSAVLRRTKALGLTGVVLATAGTLLGGAEVRIAGPVSGTRALGLDWFLLNLLLLALVFVPLERVFARRPDQPVFRFGWVTDLTHFAVSHLLVQVTVVLTLVPATVFFHWAARPWLQARVAAQPMALQLLEVLLVADLTQYAVHRAFHQVPWLWRFHAIHHSSRTMDWLAGSRLHIVDIVAIRGLTFVPLYVLGFAPAAVYAYAVFVSFHAVFIHANVRFKLRALDWLLVTPRFHHWHHAAHPEAVDRNFAVHLPWIDRLFGTAHLPDAWPDTYGIAGDPVPEGYTRQLVWPWTGRLPKGAPGTATND
jgi:sterol desaturase/sphingolipid hydroxylase (fatty acid hydroxylase superfamily)